MRRFLLVCAFVLLACPAWAQSIFDLVTTSPGGTFTGTVKFADGSELSASGIHLSTTSSLTAPDTATWSGSGLLFPTTGTVTLPDRTVIRSTGTVMAAASTFRGPDASVWSSNGISLAAGKQLAIANGTSSAPGLSFALQATAGWYREAADDLRLVLSGSILALRAYKANATSGVVSVPVGASTSYAVIGGRICTSTASAATTGLTTEILASCLLPPHALSIDGAGVKVKAWGTTAANANNKTLRIDVGGSTCSTLTAATNNGTLVVESTILRTGDATQDCAGTGIASSGTVSATHATPAEDTTANMTISAKAATPTAIGDFTLKGMTVELIN